MEERDRHQCRPRHVRIGFRYRLALPQIHPGRAGQRIEHVRDHGAVGRQRAFRLSRRTGRIHDRCVVIRADIHRRHAEFREVSPGIRRADGIFHGRDARMVMFVAGLARDDDVFQVRQVFHMLMDALVDLRIDDGSLHAREGQAVFQFLAGPPGVHGRGDRAEAEGRIEGHRPLRIVAHDHGDAVALGDAVLVAQRGSEVLHRPQHRLIGHPLILIDDVVPVRVGHRGQEKDRVDVRRRVRVALRRNAIDDRIFHLNRRPGSGQCGVGLGDGHGGPIWGKQL